MGAAVLVAGVIVPSVARAEGPTSLTGTFYGETYGPRSGGFSGTQLLDASVLVQGVRDGGAVQASYGCELPPDGSVDLVCQISDTDSDPLRTGILPATFTLYARFAITAPVAFDVTPVPDAHYGGVNAGTYQGTNTIFDGLVMNCAGPASQEFGLGGLIQPALITRWGFYAPCTVS